MDEVEGMKMAAARIHRVGQETLTELMAAESQSSDSSPEDQT